MTIMLSLTLSITGCVYLHDLLSNRDCLRQCINESQEADMKCPYSDGKFACDCVIEEREIRAVSGCHPSFMYIYEYIIIATKIYLT